MITLAAMLFVFVVMLILGCIESQRSFQSGVAVGKKLAQRGARVVQGKVIHFPLEVTRRAAGVRKARGR